VKYHITSKFDGSIVTWLLSNLHCRIIVFL